MGVDLGKLVEAKEIELSSLAGRKVAIDAFNAIYQFLSIIRQSDGTPLMDSNGKITSHLSGLFYRTMRLLEIGLLPSYVFDGKPPVLKEETIKERQAIREEAREKWKSALRAGRIEEAKKYAQATSKLSEEMLNESKELLEALGIPFVQAPSEGEAQAAYICQMGDVYAVGSQDFDSLLFGAPRLIRNLTITGRRKVPRKNYYVEIKPEFLELAKILSDLKITREQLIEVGILIGTDFNPGIKGIGPKKALQHILQKPIKEWAEELEFSINPEKVKEIFLNPEVTKDYTLKWREPNQDKLIEILHEKHEFSKERIENALEKLDKSKSARTQKSLDRWF